MKIHTDKNFGSRECPSCACDVPANQNRCPICSYEFPHPTPAKRAMKTWGAWLMILLFLVLVLGLVRWL